MKVFKLFFCLLCIIGCSNIAFATDLKSLSCGANYGPSNLDLLETRLTSDKNGAIKFTRIVNGTSIIRTISPIKMTSDTNKDYLSGPTDSGEFISIEIFKRKIDEISFYPWEVHLGSYLIKNQKTEEIVQSEWIYCEEKKGN